MNLLLELFTRVTSARSLLGLAADPVDHVRQHAIHAVPADLGFLTPNGEITVMSDQISMIVLAGLLLVILLPILVRRRRGGDAIGDLVPTGSANMIEAVCGYLRKEVAEPALAHHTDRFIKFIWTVFFFVLTLNVLGLLPIPAVSQLGGLHLGGTATANIWVTATLAIITLVMMMVNGVRLGGKQFFAHLNPGPWWLAWLLVPLELIVGPIAKAFALAVRLFANMVAGHVLLAVLLSFILSAGAKSAGMGFAIAVPVVAGSVAVSLLEIFVAFLQAYIFTFLTTLFIGQLTVFHHDDHAEAHA